MKKMYYPRLKQQYEKDVVPALMSSQGYSNIMQVPRLVKIVVNIGVSEARENIKALDTAAEELAAITGQRPSVRRSRKSISNFKLREKMPIGVMVTLRGIRMYEFYDRLVSIAIPRIRDFRGLPNTGFDGHGNYNMGLREQYMFTEINLDKSDAPRGMNISLVTTAQTDVVAREFLVLMGMPFRKN